ncbi:hypothetical protein AC578_10180 [Pseudocercospora eumusae]|uniref:Uncharacterized protein n=1 Tax=Pseudocercospora eumusae TaxID=321146 RepID=A0A139HZ30_9PEZI|nr:hypothetical protein AC578_10180 [Pseudocercospora eumusae]
MRALCAESSTKTTIVEVTRRVPGSPLRTPATLASAGALRSLHDLILTQDACLLDETRKRNLERHLKKFAKAAHALFAKGALQRSAKSTILSKAKVMNFKDLVKFREKRQEKEAAKEMKKIAKQGRKRKAANAETDMSQSQSKVARLADSLEYIEGYVAPVARMW